MKGEHYRLSPKIRAEVSQQLKILGIPRYTLIDQDGKIFYKTAPRPSDFDYDGNKVVNKYLESIIKGLLDEADE